ncbi:unnamed protein product [Trichobilharzia szidati]|nr:unnamed protein product [Trichobilharzia szidati]
MPFHQKSFTGLECLLVKRSGRFHGLYFHLAIMSFHGPSSSRTDPLSNLIDSKPPANVQPSRRTYLRLPKVNFDFKRYRSMYYRRLKKYKLEWKKHLEELYSKSREMEPQQKITPGNIVVPVNVPCNSIASSPSSEEHFPIEHYSQMATKQFLLVKVPAIDKILVVSEVWVAGEFLILPQSYSCADVMGHAEFDEGSTPYKFNLLARFNDFEQAVKTAAEIVHASLGGSSSEDTEPASQCRVSKLTSEVSEDTAPLNYPSRLLADPQFQLETPAFRKPSTVARNESLLCVSSTSKANILVPMDM